MTYKEYWKEVRDIASSLVSEAMTDCENDRNDALESIYDRGLHETIDGHEWVIYYSHNLDVIRHSDNEDYYEQNFGGDCIKTDLERGGIDGLHVAMAFWCMYADVSDCIETAMDEYEISQEAESIFPGSATAQADYIKLSK